MASVTLRQVRVAALVVIAAGPALFGCGASPTPEPGLPCETTIAEACADHATGCSWLDWGTPPTPPYVGAPYTFGQCGPYDVAVAHGVGAASVMYYDQGTHELVAVVVHYGGTRCSAGPPRFFEPTCF